MGLVISVEKIKDIHLIRLSGRIIDIDSKKLKKRLESLFKKKIAKIILDISDTEFIDSNGLGVIVYYHTLLQKSNRQLILFNNNQNPQAYMTRLLELTQLNRVFTVVSDLKDILEK